MSVITERVPTGRRGPLAVVLVALALVALLAWRPWAAPVEPLPSPSTVAVRPTSSPTPLPTPSALPTSTAIPTATPAPTLAVLAIDVASAPDATRAFVECRYRQAPHGASALTSLSIGPPTVEVVRTYAFESPDVRRVAWHAELEVNRLETLFSADWEPLARSPSHSTRALNAIPLAFSRLSMSYDQLPIGPTLVVRVVVVVQWFGPSGVRLGTSSIVATNYAHGESGPVLPEGCHTVTG